LRRELKRHRLRFRIAHELGHTFFYSRAGKEPRRGLFDSPAQEEFCDTFARELLVPRHCAKRVKRSPEALLRLQARCDVSLKLAARAVSAAQPEASVALWFIDPEQEVALQWASDPAAGAILPIGAGLDEELPPGVELLPMRRQLLSVC
jgi:hypothetical protein